MEPRFLTKIGEKIIVLEPPPEKVFQWRRSGNIVLVKGFEGVTLFDSGGASSKYLLLSLLKSQINTQTNSIDCLHTHGHIDHISGDEILIKKFNAQIWASEEAIPFVAQQSPLFLKLESPQLIVNFNELFSAPEWFVKCVMRLTMGKNKPIKNVRTLEQDSDPSGTNFLPIRTPGHHAGHLGFFNHESGIFISGDILDPRYGMKPLLTSPSSSFDKLKDSIKKILNLSIKILIPGHGNPVMGSDAIKQGLHTALKIMNQGMQGVISSLNDKTYTLQDFSLKLRGIGLGPRDIFRRMFIHSVLKKLYSENKISKEVDRKNQTWFSLCT